MNPSEFEMIEQQKVYKSFNCIVIDGFKIQISISESRSRYVQIATINEASALEIEGEAFKGWYVTLNKKTIDDLIVGLQGVRDWAND